MEGGLGLVGLGYVAVRLYSIDHLLTLRLAEHSSES